MQLCTPRASHPGVASTDNASLVESGAPVGIGRTVRQVELALGEKQRGRVLTATPVEPKCYWQVSSETNPVTGAVTKTASLQYQGKQNIYVRQMGKKLQCSVTTDDFLETTSNLDSRNSTVRYKFDSAAESGMSWNRHQAKTLSIQYRPVARFRRQRRSMSLDFRTPF